MSRGEWIVEVLDPIDGQTRLLRERAKLITMQKKDVPIAIGSKLHGFEDRRVSALGELGQPVQHIIP